MHVHPGAPNELADIDWFVLPHLGYRRLAASYFTKFNINPQRSTWPWSRRIPPVELVTAGGAITTFQALHGGRGVLFDLTDDAHLRPIAAGWADALLMRPDGYVAWATPDHPHELSGVLGRWFGTPEASA